jgi:LAS superfamily LD-carboxypeptidase LdcB
VNLQVISGFRSHQDQMGIWNRKWQAGSALDDQTRVNQILKFSSMPGISRHHWGTDVDFNNLNPSYWQSGAGQKALQWLRANAPSFGFCEPYSGKNQGKRTGGYEDEPWHWSYKAIAQPLQNQRSASLNDVLNQPISGQHIVKAMPARMSAYVTSVGASCR